MPEEGGAPAARETADDRKTKLDPAVLRVVAVVLLGPFMSQIDATVVNVSLSAIRDDLHSSTETAQWIVSAYLLALALMLPLNGWLVDRIGAKRLYLGCFTLFTVTSMGCGAARSMAALVAARVLQGMAGGRLAPLAGRRPVPGSSPLRPRRVPAHLSRPRRAALRAGAGDARPRLRV